MRDTQRPAGVLPAADELDDFQARAVRQRRGFPLRWFDDVAVQLYRYAGGIESEVQQQLTDRLTGCQCTRFTVDHDLNPGVG